MSTESILKQVNALWNIVSSSSLAASPLVAVDQIACLIMIKYLDYAGFHTSWSALLKDSNPAERLSTVAFHELRKAERLMSLNGHFKDAYFQLEAAKPEALRELLSAVNSTFKFNKTRPFTRQANGTLFDTLLSLASVGGNSLPVTPRRISRLMVSLLDPRPGQSLIDPAAGTARLLLYGERYMGTGRNGDRNAPTGIEMDKSSARIAWVNLLLNRCVPTQMHYGNSVAEPADHHVMLDEVLGSSRYDFVLSDIPYGNIGELNSVKKADYLPDTAYGKNDTLTNRLELLYIWRTIDLLKGEGRAALKVSQSVLYGNTRAQVRLRRELLSRHVVEGIILLPQSSSPEAILVFAKKDEPKPIMAAEPCTRSVWFYEFSPKGGENGYGDLYDALVHFRRQHSAVDRPLNTDIYYKPLPPTTSNTNSYTDDALEDLVAIDMEGRRPDRHPLLLLRTPSTHTRQWRIPVRDWAHKPDWRNRHGQRVGSHDENHHVRAEYVAATQRHLYIDDELQPDLLAPSCIEAQNWTLDINEYRWPLASGIAQGASTVELIEELRAIELDILHRLDQLQALLGEAQ